MPALVRQTKGKRRSGGEGSRYAHGGDGPEFGVSGSRIGAVDPDGDVIHRNLLQRGSNIFSSVNPD